ncbi:PH and SEC7 domain-containing protein 3 [Trichonephila clavata]|uniref:PH and SEC7 domain-containing protein 3 n=1 Tax=Trichonephila clavata TaxID=2740835 RepID=A0A8X6LG74_TRICU|nr:PH and SEC7 domain-containing protein 3 [Trichonephila clavata]
MERCENRVIIKDSNFKQTLANIETLKNERASDISPSISMSCTNNISYHNIDCGENIFCSKKILPNKKAFVMPNEMYISLNSDPTQPSKPVRNDIFSSGCHSTPASPEETERTRNKQLKKDLSSFHSPIIDKKLPFSFSTSFVRTSRSEDHLRKSSLTTVNIDIEDELASSLDTLLDTKADDVFYDFEKDESLGNSCPETISRTKSPDEPLKSDDVSQSSSDTASVSKVSVKITDAPEVKANTSEPLSESSGSEIIPSDSSTTIRRDSEGSGDCECTSEQISAISSLDDATDSDLGSPVGSLSPETELNLDAAWMADLDTKDCVLDVFQDITNKSKMPNSRPAKPQPPNIELNLTSGLSDAHKLQPSALASAEKSPTSLSSSLSVPKAYEDKFDLSTESPTSQCSEDTFGDLSYHELTESYDEISIATEAAEDVDQYPPTQRSESPPTDDESDIESLHSFHYSPKAVDIPSAIRLAKRLFFLDGFKKTDVSRHLSKNNEFSKAVAEEYVKFFDFNNDGLDVALRKFLNQFCLVGETQERERVLLHFSKRYLDCNPNSFKSQDAVHTLTCALMLLNSDLHGENVRRKMVCGEFIQNLAELNDGDNFPREVLKTLYHSIKTHPLEWALDQEDDKKISSKEKNTSDYRQSFSCHNPFLEIPNPNCATEYKKGYVMRKCCMDPSGKKTALGRRSWKMLYLTLRDLILYHHKDEHGFKKNQLYESINNCTRIHHAFAEKAVDYTKKQFVFRLHTADQAVYLFQTSDSKELDSWVDTINLVSASLSAPPLPGGVGYQRKFQRPLLPISHTKLNLREQLQDHETRIVWLEKEYEELLTRTPEKALKSRFVHEYAEKEAYLLNELTRYRTYAFLLRTRMAQHPELETPLVQTSIGELEEPVEKSKSGDSPQSSPSKKSHNSAPPLTESNAVHDKSNPKIP